MHSEKQSEDTNSDITHRNNPLDFPVEKWLLPIIGFVRTRDSYIIY